MYGEQIFTYIITEHDNIITVYFFSRLDLATAPEINYSEYVYDLIVFEPPAQAMYK